MFFSIQESLSALRSKKISALDLVNFYIDRIEKHDTEIDSYTQTCFDRARVVAKKLDEQGDFSAPLAGIPYSLKDVISIEGLKNTAGSKILKDYVPPYTATVAKKLEAAGAILLGKVNTDEFTMGSSCETSAIAVTKNPWNTQKVPGGSSGGSAAAVAKNLCMFSIGTDTGGSIRQPANFCGITGLKVSYGRVSRYGCIPYASSFDSVGVLAKTVEDTALVLSVIAGKDEHDSTTPAVPVEKYAENLPKNLRGKKIGVIKEFMQAEGLSDEVRASVEKSLETAKNLGAEIVEISLPLTEYAIPTYYLLVKAEASTNLARFDGVRFGHAAKSENLHDLYKKSRSEGFGDEVKRAIMMGTYTLSAGYFDAYYKKAAKVRTLFQKEYLDVFEKVDALFAPVSPFPAFDIGEKMDDPLAMYLADIFTVSPNLAGICGIAIPTNLLSNGLPSGIQILGKPFAEKTIVDIAHVMEKTLQFPFLKD